MLHWLVSNWLQPNLGLSHSVVLKQHSFEMGGFYYFSVWWVYGLLFILNSINKVFAGAFRRDKWIH